MAVKTNKNAQEVKVPGWKPIKSTEGKKFNEKDLIKDMKALEKALWPKEPKQVIRVSIKEIK